MKIDGPIRNRTIGMWYAENKNNKSKTINLKTRFKIELFKKRNGGNLICLFLLNWAERARANVQFQ